jgi:AraC-like DNA-binding protein
MRKSLILQFLMTLEQDRSLQAAFRSLPKSFPRADLIQRVLLVIEQEPVRFGDVNDLARHVGMSRSGLYRLLQSAGLPTPAALLEQARLEAAARLLRETNDSVLSIAMDCGFGSLSSFYRIFRRAYGVAPGQWRAR